MRENKYAQFTQTTVSRDGIHFEVRPGITARSSYERIFRWQGITTAWAGWAFWGVRTIC